jgi:hypothetical protein
VIVSLPSNFLLLDHQTETSPFHQPSGARVASPRSKGARAIREKWPNHVTVSEECQKSKPNYIIKTPTSIVGCLFTTFECFKLTCPLFYVSFLLQKEQEQQRRRRSKAQFFDMIKEVQK